MRKVVLYIAYSLDNYIATSNGSVDWLESVENTNQLDFGYSKLYSTIDTNLMGNGTCKKILNLGVEFLYQEKENFVFAHGKDTGNVPYVTFVSQTRAVFVEEIKNQSGGDIWLVRGEEINSLLLNQNLIDRMILTIFLAILGSGIPMFKNADESKFQLSDQEIFDNDMVQLVLDRKA